MADRVVRNATRAAEDAVRCCSRGNALATQYERVVSVLEQQTERDEPLLCDMLLALGDAHIRALERHNVMPVFLRAAEIAYWLGFDDRLARAAIGYGYMAKAGVADDEARVLWDRALACTGDPALRAMLMAARARTCRSRDHTPTRATRAKSCVDIARTTNDKRALVLGPREPVHHVVGRACRRGP